MEKRNSVLRRIISGLGANMASNISVILIQIAGVPLLLHSWGVQTYGEWLILFAVPSYLAMMDLGFSLSAGNDMTQKVAIGDRDGALRVFQSLCALVCCSFAVVMLVVLSLVLLLPIELWWHSADVSPMQVRFVILLLAGEVMLRLLGGANSAGFRSNRDYPLDTSIYTVTGLLQNIALWGAALSGLGLVGAATAYFAVRLVATPTSSCILLFRHRWIKIGFQRARRADLLRLAKPALANVSTPLASAINQQGMVFVIGGILGAVPVVVYSTLRTLSRFVLQANLLLSYASEPELASAHGRKDDTLIRQIVTNIVRLGMWGAFVICVALWLLGDTILTRWTHGTVAMDAGMFGFLLVGTLIGSFWQGSLVIFRATNNHLRIAVAYCIAAMAAIGLAAILLSVTDRLMYAGMALLLMDTAITVYALHLMSRRMGINVTQFGVLVLNPVPVLRKISLTVSKWCAP